jgi:hypothetical protein
MLVGRCSWELSGRELKRKIRSHNLREAGLSRRAEELQQATRQKKWHHADTSLDDSSKREIWRDPEKT